MRLRSINLVPNSRRDGGLTAGPPASVQVSFNLRFDDPPVLSQATVSRPAGAESDPYLAALLASSWIAIASAKLAFDVNITSLPSIANRCPC